MNFETRSSQVKIDRGEDEENVFNQGRISVDIDEGTKLVDDQEKDAQVKGRQADTQAEIYNIDLDHTSKVLSMQEDTEVQEVVEVVNAAKLMTEVVTAAATQVVAVSTPISAAKPKVLKIVAAAPAVSTRKRKGVVIRDPEEELHDDTPAETLSTKDKGKGIFFEDPKPIKKKDQIEMDAEYARKLQEEEESHVQAKDVQVKDVQAKGIQFDANMRFLLKSREEMEKEEEEIIKSINKTPTQKASKRRRLREQAKEDENLKKQLEVVVDEDDVFIEATLIGRKVPVVNYEIVMINNKPRSKENTKCVSAAGEELTVAKHKLILLELKLFRDAAAAAHMNTNVANAPREPFVVKPDHGVNSSQNPPHIDECCYECGDALDGIFCQQCTFKSCGKGVTLELAKYINTPGWNRPAFYDNDDDDDVDYTIAITPVLSIEEPVDSLSMGDKHLDTIPATESDEVIKSSVEDLVPISTLKDNPTQSSELLTKSSSTSLNSLLEDANTFHNSLSKFKNFYFDLGEISSGSTTTHSDISLPDYEAFYFDDDHIKEISSGSTTTHSDISLSEYDSFIFDLTHEEFVDELAHIIFPPKYDCFYFRDLPDQGELMSVLNSGIRENLSTTLVNLPIKDDYSPLLAYVVWIFLSYLTYPVIPPYLHLFGNEDTIFDPGITINSVDSFEPVSSHRHGAFKKINTHRSHLNEWPMIINGKNTPLLDVRLPFLSPLIKASMGGIESS
nr:hypothetical protein [Tanacetum cinerariifolium]